MTEAPKHIPASLSELLEARWPIQQKILLIHLVQRGGREAFHPNEVAKVLFIEPAACEQAFGLLERLGIVYKPDAQRFALVLDHPVRQLFGSAEAIALQKRLDALSAENEALKQAPAPAPVVEEKPKARAKKPEVAE